MIPVVSHLLYALAAILIGTGLGWYATRVDHDLAAVATAPDRELRPLTALTWSGIGSAAAGVIATIGAAHPMPGMELLALAAGGSALSLLVAVDLRHMILPDLLVFVLGVLGLAWSFSPAPSAPLPLEAVFGALAAGGLTGGLRLAYKALRKREGMGFGDVKLAAAAGFWLGVELIGLFLLLAALFTLFAALIASWLRSGRLSGSAAMPFGPGLAAAGAALTVLRILQTSP